MSPSNRYNRGPFSFSWTSEAAVEYLSPSGQTIVLKDSGHLSDLINLNDGWALGYDRTWQSYQPDFQRAGWLKKQSGTQMGLWNLQTGERQWSFSSGHFGDVVGAERFNNEQLLTWGRDYLARIWNIRTGKLDQVLPLPLQRSEQGSAIISSHAFSHLSNGERTAYISQQHLPAPDVQIYAMASPGHAQRNYGLYPGNHTNFDGAPALHPPFSELLAPNWIEDMQNAEAGYSTTRIMKDGRRITGGTTYGASGIVYVWDGLFDLTLLLPGKARECFEIIGEVAPDTLEMGEWVEHYDNNGPLYRWLL